MQECWHGHTLRFLWNPIVPGMVPVCIWECTRSQRKPGDGHGSAANNATDRTHIFNSEEHRHGLVFDAKVCPCYLCSPPKMILCSHTSSETRHFDRLVLIGQVLVSIGGPNLTLRGGGQGLSFQCSALGPSPHSR